MLMLFYCSSFFFFKQKTAYEMRISDWSSDVCSSDLERKLCGLVAALAAVFEVGAEPGTEKLGLHPEPGSETDQAEAGRHRDDGVVRFACDDAELVPEVGQRNNVAQPAEQGRRSRRPPVVQPVPPVQIGRASGRERECQYG